MPNDAPPMVLHRRTPQRTNVPFHARITPSMPPIKAPTEIPARSSSPYEEFAMGLVERIYPSLTFLALRR